MSHDGVKKALAKFEAKNSPKTQAKPRKKSTKPEKALEKLICRWLRLNGFICNVVESRAVYNPKANRYINGQTHSGFSDIVGSDKNGISVYIELKAPGRLRDLKPHQYDFLLARLESNCFAVCVDSVEMLSEIYGKWCDLKEDYASKRAYLKQVLRKPILKGDKDLLFD